MGALFFEDLSRFSQARITKLLLDPEKHWSKRMMQQLGVCIYSRACTLSPQYLSSLVRDLSCAFALHITLFFCTFLCPIASSRFSLKCATFFLLLISVYITALPYTASPC